MGDGYNGQSIYEREREIAMCILKLKIEIYFYFSNIFAAFQNVFYLIFGLVL